MSDMVEAVKTLGLPAAFCVALLLMLGGLMMALVKAHNRFLNSISTAVGKIAEVVSGMKDAMDSSNRRMELAISQRDAQHQLIMAKLEELRRARSVKVNHDAEDD